MYGQSRFCTGTPQFLRIAVVASLAIVMATPARAQDTLADVVLRLWNGTPSVNGTRIVDGSIFGATVWIEVNGANRQIDNRRLRDDDFVSSFRITRGANTLEFPGGSGQEFKSWLRARSSTLASEYLFPTSVSESVSGKDAAQNQAQQFLLNTAMAVSAARDVNRLALAGNGGMFEVESLAGDGHSAVAFQGRYRFQGAHLSLTGRYSQQQEGAVDSATTLTAMTRSLSLATDFHPSAVVNDAIDLRIGADARAGVLLTRASTLDFGSIDYAGGVWMSARRDFSRVRIGGGGLLQASKSHVPGSIGGDLQILADTINDAQPAWDLSYGLIGGYAVTSQTSLNGKILQTQPLQVDAIARPQTTILMGSVSHLIGGLTPIDVGYKFSATAGIRSHGIFIQGNYGW